MARAGSGSVTDGRNGSGGSDGPAGRVRALSGPLNLSAIRDCGPDALASPCVSITTNRGMQPVKSYLRNLYARTMQESYAHARREALAGAGAPGWTILDCGAANGSNFLALSKESPIDECQYTGIEWASDLVEQARSRGLSVRQGDLNKPLPYDDGAFDCVLGLSVLEHLLHGCAYISEAQRVLKPGGKLVLLTPNISTYFTIALLIAGRMPSTGPHPDSDRLNSAAIKMEMVDTAHTAEGDTPPHRHLVVFSYRMLGRFLSMAGFERVQGRGFGLYPFPNFMQPMLGRLDPWHCHQMVFTARKP